MKHVRSNEGQLRLIKRGYSLNLSRGAINGGVLVVKANRYLKVAVKCTRDIIKLLHYDRINKRL